MVRRFRVRICTEKSSKLDFYSDKHQLTEPEHLIILDANALKVQIKYEHCKRFQTDFFKLTSSSRTRTLDYAGCLKVQVKNQP